MIKARTGSVLKNYVVVITEKASKIEKKEFYGDKKLTNGRTGTGAFSGIGPGAVYTVPRVKMQAYKKLLITKGANL